MAGVEVAAKDLLGVASDWRMLTQQWLFRSNNDEAHLGHYFCQLQSNQATKGVVGYSLETSGNEAN